MDMTASDLRLGDVLLYHGDGFLSRLIRQFDGGTYSHASIYDGQNIMEALGDGIEVRAVGESIAKTSYVDVFRFVNKDGHHLGDADLLTAPLLGSIQTFESNRQRYAYEEILLLSVLASTRKIPFDPGLALIVRNLLDSAANVLANLIAAGKQPVICSELVFRCYENAGRNYELLISGADIPSNSLAMALVDASAPAGAAELQSAAQQFLVRYLAAKGRTPAMAMSALSGQISMQAVANFVTPHDLELSPTLQRIGRLTSSGTAGAASIRATGPKASAIPPAGIRMNRVAAMADTAGGPAETPITPMNYCTSKKGVFDDTSPQEMKEAMTAFRASPPDRSLALFFHGGLVDKASGMRSARQLFGPYASNSGGPGPAGNAYPYFFVWESGLFETLQNNLPGIAAETIFRRLLDILGRKAHSVVTRTAANAAALSALQIPPNSVPRALTSDDIEEVYRAVETDPLIDAEKLRISMSARPAGEALMGMQASGVRVVQSSPVTLLSPEIVAAIVVEEQHRAALADTASMEALLPPSLGTLALGAGKILVRVIQRFASGRDHGLHNTIVEEIFRQFYVANVGWSIWNEMKVETAQAFQGDVGAHVGSAMIQELMALYESGDPGLNRRVTLVGHSAGAVYICNFLAAMNIALQNKPYRDRVRFDVIVMAPAARIDLTSETFRSCGSLVRNFRCFELSDAIEMADILIQSDSAGTAVNALLAQIYGSSLLYFIAGVLEDSDDDTPIVGMARYLSGNATYGPGKFPIIDALKSSYGRFPTAVVSSDTSTSVPRPLPGQKCSARHHGGFPIDPATLDSVCYLLRTADYSGVAPVTQPVG